MIPKVIHYFWLGGKPKPRLVRKCIASWRRHCPGWEIREWNERNVDLSVSKFAEDAYRAKKWGFVPDPLRLLKVWEEGGVYLDTDVELIAPIDDLLAGGPFFACERDNPRVINPGLGFAAEKGNSVLKAMADRYASMTFDPACHVTQASPVIATDVISAFPDCRCLPARVMNPMGNCSGKVRLSRDTVAIHHYAASWFNWKQRLVYKILPHLGLNVAFLVGRLKRR